LLREDDPRNMSALEDTMHPDALLGRARLKHPSLYTGRSG
jgi:hypothetical protein